MGQIKKAWFMCLELAMRFVISPYARARLLNWCGATIGGNVRIYEIQLFNLGTGFRNLRIEDDVHIGTGCRLDLEGPIVIRRGATLAPGVSILTHSDPGSHHHSPICREFAPYVAGVEVGAYCWIGCNATIMPGSTIADRTVVGACSLVKGSLDPESLYVGAPETKVRALTLGQ